jgi:hypothetical protein
MERLIWRAFLSMAIVLGTCSLAQADQRGNHCSLKTLRGTYVFTASGYDIVAGVPQPKAIIEVIEFNGDGTLTVGPVTLSLYGTILRIPPGGFGTYSVEEDCSGTIIFAGPIFDIVVSRDAETISMIQTNPNTVFQGTATRRLRAPERR